MSEAKEWDPVEAMEVILAVIKEEVSEEALTDDECEALAAKIVGALEGTTPQ